MLHSSENPQFSSEERTRFQHFTLFLLVGLPLMISFGIVNFLDGNYAVTGFCTVSGVGLSLGWVVIRLIGKGKIVYRINTLLFAILISYLIVFGGEAGSKILWVYIFPLISFFLFGKKEGIFWSLFSILIILILFLVPPDVLSIYNYHPEFKVRFVASYITVTAITYWLEYFRHHYSQKLAVQNEALNREIAERKEIELERERLIAEVQDASKAKSEFLANMSHEIRTPLNGVIGMTTLLLDTELNNEQKHHVRTLKKSGEFLLTIINDILDVSKIEAGKLELARTSFSLREMLDGFCDIASQKVYNSDVELIVGTAPDIHDDFFGDPDRLQQILLNLTSNALKFTRKGSVFVSVDKKEETPNDIVLRFSVKDTGIGIDDADKSRLFESFSQIDGSTTREHSGTGLGLSISKQLAELLGGGIGVESTPGVGSDFWFTARLDKNNLAEEGLKRIVPDLKGQTVLLITLNTTLKSVLLDQLRHWGAKVEQASDVKTARKIFEDSEGGGDSIDVFVVDQFFLTGSNADFNSVVRKHIKETRSQLIILTSHTTKQVFDSTFVTKAIVILEKPVKYRDFERCFIDKNVENDSAVPFPGIVEDHKENSVSREDFRILLAEDNAINQQVMTGVLARLGFSHVDTADTGLDALAALDQNHYDLILMDISMPKMDGLTATREVRSGTFTKNSCDIPIIALTAHAIVGDREKCIDAGMNDYLTKPIKPELLEKKIDQWLGGNSERDPDAVRKSAAKSDNNDTLSLVRFDYEGTVKRLMGDVEMTKEVIQIFLDEMPSQLQSLRGHIQDWNVSKIEEQAHKMVGVSANLEANIFCSIARQIETHCRNNTAERSNVAGLYSELEFEFQAVKDEMAGYL
ncbi:response regulator [Desulfosediminicola flagellatus]|uniref:response regulator n=1 Tax=Desulfosediminicola flagellatus TaxID=2569541 RepID=UPI00142EAD49|nr:response regulator [Desulfosediminicola flagellatus]